MAMWPRHMISFVILFNNIQLSPLIVLTYHFVPNGLLFQYTKPHLSIIGNCHSYIGLLKNTPAIIFC